MRFVLGLLAVLWIGLGAAPRSDASCDAALVLADLDPLHGAAAIELCEASVEGSPGVVSAAYGSADQTTPLDQLSNGSIGVGLLASFGANIAPRGDRMLALSSGTARDPSQPGWSTPSGYDKGYASGWPTGLPYEIPLCQGVIAAQPHDSVSLRLELRVPSFAHSLSFQFKFHTYDFPAFPCSSYNDWFFATLSPAPPSGPNLVFDAAGNPMTVNSPELLGVCASQVVGGSLNYPCPNGASELGGTGFEDHAATPWLTTRAPVTPDTTITLDLGIADAGDGTFDSTVLIDDFRWSSVAVASPVTTVPEPDGALVVLLALGSLAVRVRARSMSRRARARLESALLMAIGLAPLQTLAGGPPAFGYLSDDSHTEPGLFSFQDISTTGTRLMFYDPLDLFTQKEDEGIAPDVSLASLNGGQGFPFYGTFFDAVTMSTNGFLHFEAGADSVARANECPLSATAPNGLIAVVWDDLIVQNFGAGGGFVEPFDSCPYTGGGTGGGGCVVFQWTDADHAGGGGPDRFDTQAVLYDSGNILLLYPEGQYPDGNFEHGAGSTTGIQNHDGSDSLMEACDTNNSLPPNFAVLFIYPAPEPAAGLGAIAAAIALAARRRYCGAPSSSRSEACKRRRS